MTPQVMEFKYWLGISYSKIGDKNKAKTQLAKVYSKDINYNDIQNHIEALGIE